MLQYSIQRLLLAIPTLLGITLISFLVMRLAPGDPVDLFLGGAAGGEGLTTDRRSDIEKTRQELRRQLGLDRPLYVQYLSWLTNLVLRAEPLDEFERMALLADDDPLLVHDVEHDPDPVTALPDQVALAAALLAVLHGRGHRPVDPHLLLDPGAEHVVGDRGLALAVSQVGHRLPEWRSQPVVALEDVFHPRELLGVVCRDGREGVASAGKRGVRKRGRGWQCCVREEGWSI